MKKVRIIELILLLCSLNRIIVWLFYPIDAFKNPEYNSCTIFTVTEGDKVYFCNNEDCYPRHMRMWFFPASDEKHGKVLYGFTIHDAFNPLGGMNDEGLSADENWVPLTPLKRDPDKMDYIRNNLFTKLLEHCATVEEVIEWIKDYNLVQLETYPCQIHIVDKTGDAVVIGIGT